MRELRLGAIVSLLRQGLELEIGFGTRSVEALVWIAEAVEESVYAAGSLVRTATGLQFRLSNPPLRLGAFRELRLIVDGRPVAPERLRFRRSAGGAWRTAASLSEAEPLVLLPGEPTEIAADGVEPRIGGRAELRLELSSVAIPPRVWVEFSDEVREEPLS
jgi:hypothetical protein